MASRFHARSISLPSRSHPTTQRIEEELNKLKTWEASSKLTTDSIRVGLSGVDHLYKCVDDILHMASTKEAVSRHQNENFLDGLLDGSVSLLDICGLTRDFMLQIKEHVQALQSAIRRRKNDSILDNEISNYACFRKKIKKNAKRFTEALKQMENEVGLSPLVEQDLHLSAVIRVLREVNSVNSSILRSLLSFLSTPVSKPKQSRWSLVSKLMYKGVIACEGKQEKENEWESVDTVLSEVSKFDKASASQEKLEALKTSIEDLEIGLQSVFRGLIKTRASLLNMVSQ
ncbi:hypothetical protein K2173_006012 [Erythroxylum novogranatense]|uniref:DUF241 domain protein n=1 Tax=Erythroxylum novogranatense TaxID=1862640 RepID=A0AAV8TBN3_9ROSI|nr:hypothetical protein K2173_006012 [Erythroxylum novogranatense]